MKNYKNLLALVALLACPQLAPWRPVVVLT